MSKKQKYDSRIKEIDRTNVPQWLIDLPGNCQNQ